MMSDQRMLIAFAHPDDESFGMGGTIAKYVASGTDVYLICATDGDVGTIPDDMQDDYESIRDLRLAELACANETLGFARIYPFGYKDSGMMGHAANQDPACLWYAHQHDHETLVRRVVAVMREVQPQVVVTFNAYGGYGHPDHIAIQRATVDAFQLAGDAGYITDGYPPYQPQKLYYSALPNTMLRLFLWVMRLRGQNPRKMGVNEDIDFMAVIDNLEPIHTRVDVRDYFDVWDAANACHRSQGGGTSMAGGIPAWLRRWVLGRQGYTRVHPPPSGNRVDETDLFAGVMTEPIRSVVP